MTFTYGSLFSGIGGIDLGLDRAGMRCEWQVEIDAYCQKVLAKRWPDVARYGDIRTVGKHNLTPVDLIAGGFPCQDISPAGKRKGIEGERSGLWAEYYRVVCEIRPRFVLVENSADLLKRGMGRVLGDLARIGYDAEWRVLSAAQFGARHLRRRCFILAYSNCYQSHAPAQPALHLASGRETSPQWLYSPVAHANSNGRQACYAEPGLLQTACGARLSFPGIRSRILGGTIPKWDVWADEPTVGRVADGIPNRVQRLRGLGNAVVPQIAEYIGRCILASVEQEATA